MLIFCAVIFDAAIYTNQDNDDYRGDHKIVVQSVKMSLSRQDTVFLGGKLCKDLKNTGVIQNIKYDFLR